MSEPTQTVRVALAERSYPIEIGSGTLAEAGRFLHELSATEHVTLITDKHVEPLYAQIVGDSIAATGAEVDLVVVEPGEGAKSAELSALLWNKLLELGADRRTVIAALGGGVIGDLAGFVAATFARGIRLLQIPTTLLAQVDSSVGGKVGINLPGAKNMVGAFWQPLGVLIDTAVLDSLPKREFISGLAEVVKYGVILDAEFFEYLERHVAEILARQPHGVLRHVVARCCRLKADVVEADERELTGSRAVLNYGHTFCHAFETVTGYGTLLHGEAVSIGMICAARLAARLGRVDSSFVERQQKLLTASVCPSRFRMSIPMACWPSWPVTKRTCTANSGSCCPPGWGMPTLVDGVQSADARAALQG